MATASRLRPENHTAGQAAEATAAETPAPPTSILVDAFTRAAREFLGSELKADLVEVVEGRPADFFSGVADLSSCWLCHNADETTDTWCDIQPQLAQAMISRLLGADDTTGVCPDRPLTRLERRLGRRVVESLLTAFGESPDATGAAMTATDQPPLPTAARGAQPIVIFRMAVTLGRSAGAIRLCVPRPLVADGALNARASRPSVAPIELSVTVPDVAISPVDLEDLAPGDLVATELPVEGEVIVRIAGIPKYAARLGQFNGHRAIVITRKLL